MEGALETGGGVSIDELPVLFEAGGGGGGGGGGAGIPKGEFR